MRDLAELVGRVAELERRVYGMMRHGIVAQVDAGEGLVRMKLGESTAGGDFLGPWVPYAQHAGAIKAHIPPSVGQQMTIFSPSGDLRQAVAVPMTWSDRHASPSKQADENVVTYGEVRIALKASSLKVEIGGVSFEISDEGVTIKGGRVEHNDKNIGSTHIHGGVDPGPANTGVPAN